MSTGRRERQEAGGFAARLRQVLRAHGSASALAKTIGRSEGAVRKWLRAQSEPNVTDLRALCEMTQTRIEWLASGEGPREVKSAADPPRNLPDPARVLERESPTPDRDPAPGTLDLRLLEGVITALDEQLQAAGLTLPTPKRSALIVAAYDLARDRHGLDADAVARLVRLAH